MRTTVKQAIAAMEAAEKLSHELQDLLETQKRLQILETRIAEDRAVMSADRAKNTAKTRRWVPPKR